MVLSPSPFGMTSGTAGSNGSTREETAALISGPGVVGATLCVYEVL